MAALQYLQVQFESFFVFLSSNETTIMGHSFSWLVISLISLSFIFYLANFSFGRRKPWRTAASKKWLKRFRANAEKYSPPQRFGFIRGVDHFLWEDIIMSCFEERGYAITRTKMTRDGGIDGVVVIGNETIAIQAKRYSGPIVRSHVIAFEKLVVRRSMFTKGLFIHTGTTSKPIKEYFITSSNVYLFSGVDRILEFLDGKPINMLSQKISPIE
jgi:restriction system protein